MSVFHICVGDCRTILKQMRDRSVHCVVTSPPYWGLRDYGVAGQIGLEQSFRTYIDEIVGVFREVRRVLRDDGTLWLNLGDSYANSGRGGNPGDSPHQKQKTNAGSLTVRDQRQDLGGLKPKDLCGIPWRVAFALQADGWYLRQDIIWAKLNTMPESVADRCTKAHEYLFLLSKNERYYYDAVAVREPAAESSKQLLSQKTLAQQKGSARVPGKTNGATKAVGDGLARNKRSVWSIAPFPFKEAHFATFPPALVEPCILAGTSEAGCCAACGAPRERVVGKQFVPQTDVSEVKGVRGNGAQKPMDASNSWQDFPRGTTQAVTIGWKPACTCAAPSTPCVVLDPFGGAGTTALVAMRLKRNSILIELNQEYAELEKRRILLDQQQQEATSWTPPRSPSASRSSAPRSTTPRQTAPTIRSR